MNWYRNKGPESDIVLSTRIRLARNLKDYPFPERLSEEKREEVNGLLRDVFLKADSGLSYIRMKELSPYQCVSLAEKHLISPEFASDSTGRALLLSDEEDISIMLCEEDHVRIQVIFPGLSPEEAYGKAAHYDEILENSFSIAFSEKLGYLTQCPTNLGTGMRASVMLHLPALSAKNAISRLASTVAKLGLTLRGTYGEGTEPIGDIYQLSNQVTLGISDEAAIKNLQSITKELIAQERQAREELLRDDRVIDKIHRAFGILKTAHMLSWGEFSSLVSLVRLGASGGLLDISAELLSTLLIDTQPATINTKEGKALSTSERDVIRAKAVRDALTK